VKLYLGFTIGGKRLMTKLTHIVTALALVVGGHLYAQQPSPSVASPDVDMEKLSEAFGHFIGRNLKSPGIDFDLEMVIKGIRDGAAGKESPLSDQEYETMMALVQIKAYNQLAEDNLKAADAFMVENGRKEGISEIEPGKLQYTILEEGNGPEVEKNDSPQLHYVGKYMDGQVFSSSEEAGEPIIISLEQTIPGFGKGIVGMKEGEKRRLFIHPDLGYGTSGNLQPNALLVFDVEILKADTQEDK